MSFLSRRHFLQLMLGAGASLLLPQVTSAFTFQNPVNVPPSVMLHSRHWKVLPDLLSALSDEGYTGITYLDWEEAMSLNGVTVLPPQPVIISVDDISCEVGNPSFKYFERMKDDFLQVGFKAVFAVITRPNLRQDSKRWDTLASWSGEGFELATHTSYHSNLDNPKFIASDYQSEVVDSAAMITERSGEAVRTLVTPYGSGFDLKTGVINPNVLNACQEANLKFMVGITTGQRHVHGNIEAGDVIYAGRADPSNDNTVADALYYVKYW